MLGNEAKATPQSLPPEEIKKRIKGFGNEPMPENEEETLGRKSYSEFLYSLGNLIIHI